MNPYTIFFQSRPELLLRNPFLLRPYHHLTILDETYCAGHAGFVSGEYLILVVSDDGCGMDKETLENVFEPFFTTKELGKGTGLGFSTAYGIVKQNEGLINVYS